MSSSAMHSNQTDQQSEDFWSQALLGSALGTFLGTVTIQLLVALLDPLWSSGASFIAGGLCGLIAGATQGSFIRKHAQPKLLWLGMSCIGWLAAIALRGVATDLWPTSDLVKSWIATDALGGAIIGTTQWFVLRYNVPATIWWIPLNAGIWAAIMFGYLLLFGRLLGLASW